MSMAFIPREIITGKDEEPYSIQYDLGWTVPGQSKRKTHTVTVRDKVDGNCATYRCSTKTSKQVEQIMQLFGQEFKDAADQSKGTSAEGRLFQYLLKKETYVADDGYITMPLPFKKKPPNINAKRAALHPGVLS